MTASAVGDEALGNEKAAVRYEHPPHLAKTGCSLRPVVEGAERPDDRRARVRERQRLGAPLDPCEASGPSDDADRAGEEEHEDRVNAGHGGSTARRLARRGSGAAADVGEHVGGARAGAIGDGVCRVAAADGHRERRDQPVEPVAHLSRRQSAVVRRPVSGQSWRSGGGSITLPELDRGVSNGLLANTIVPQRHPRTRRTRDERLRDRQPEGDRGLGR